jgi:glyoxylase-like metal-dependent hydrolase (beta-lactamase superfamily II)
VLTVSSHVNSVLNSNTYILSLEGDHSVWIIDPGDTEGVLEWISERNKHLKGILVTHSHYDHIYGINELLHKYPDIKVYSSFYGKEGMMSDKLNGSRYHENPYVVAGSTIEVLNDGDRMMLWPDFYLDVLETLGHSRDCFSFYINENLFTGDALIPDHKVVTKMKFGDAEQALKSLKLIFEKFDPHTNIWPGHGDGCILSKLSFENTHVSSKH